MADGNGHKEGDLVKDCPFLKGECTKGGCALYAEMQRNQGGVQEKFGLCSLNAMVMIMSELNAKLSAPQQQIQVPNLFKG